MLKVSEINPTSLTDESGRKIAVATGPRVYFRTTLSSEGNDFSHMPNHQLDELIAADVAGSENIKTFVPRSSGIGSGTRDLGVIKKSKQYGMFYMCIASGQTLRVIKIQTEIREGPSGGEKMPSKVDTGVMDDKRGVTILVTTTVRKIFRTDYKSQAFPLDTSKTFENAGILELSKYIASLWSKGVTKYTWKDPKKVESDTSGGVLEIRSFGSNSYLIGSLKEGSTDIISVQGQWVTPATKKHLGDSRMNVSRENKKQRKQQSGSYKDKETKEVMPHGQR